MTTNTAKEKNFISAVVYVHNAKNGLEAFLKMLTEVLQANFEHSEIICVNDASEDNSKEIIKSVSESLDEGISVSIVNLSYFHGLEVAMGAGMDIAIGDFVFEFDSILVDYDTAEIMNVYRKSLEGYDIVSAASDKKDKFSSRLFYKMFAAYSGMKEKMRTETFRVLSRRVINRISSMNKTNPYRKAVYATQGLKTTILEYKSNGNKLPTDRSEKGYRSDLAMNSFMLFTELGYRFSRGMTVIMMLISLFVVAYTVVIYVTAHPVEGWTTTILFLSVAFFGLFGILTIIIKYLQLLLDLVFKRKHYSFESIEKITK